MYTWYFFEVNFDVFLCVVDLCLVLVFGCFDCFVCHWYELICGLHGFVCKVVFFCIWWVLFVTGKYSNLQVSLKAEFAIQTYILDWRSTTSPTRDEIYPVSIEAPPTCQQGQHPPTQQSVASPQHQPLEEGLRILAQLQQQHSVLQPTPNDSMFNSTTNKYFFYFGKLWMWIYDWYWMKMNWNKKIMIIEFCIVFYILEIIMDTECLLLLICFVNKMDIFCLCILEYYYWLKKMNM